MSYGSQWEKRQQNLPIVWQWYAGSGTNINGVKFYSPRLTGGLKEEGGTNWVRVARWSRALASWSVRVLWQRNIMGWSWREKKSRAQTLGLASWTGSRSWWHVTQILQFWWIQRTKHQWSLPQLSSDGRWNVFSRGTDPRDSGYSLLPLPISRASRPPVTAGLAMTMAEPSWRHQDAGRRRCYSWFTLSAFLYFLCLFLLARLKEKQTGR